MSDLRWSYDPRTDELDVWDPQDDRIGHFERTGYDGYEFCAQGRITESFKTIYGDRPYSRARPPDVHAVECREVGKEFVDAFENGKYADLPWLEVF